MRTLCAFSSVLLLTSLWLGCGDRHTTPHSLDVPPGADTGSSDAMVQAADDVSSPEMDSAQSDTSAGEDTETGPPDPPVPVLPGLGIDYSATEAGVTPRYEPTGSSWTSTPWPTDRLRDANGTPDLSNFPNPDIDMLHQYVDYAHEVLYGWGLNGGTYVTFEGAIEPNSLPSAALTKGFKLLSFKLQEVGLQVVFPAVALEGVA